MLARTITPNEGSELNAKMMGIVKRTKNFEFPLMVLIKEIIPRHIKEKLGERAQSLLSNNEDINDMTYRNADINAAFLPPTSFPVA